MVSINTNVAAAQTSRYMTRSGAAAMDAQRKLVSGSRVERASDDAAGMQIAQRLYSHTRGLDVAQANANNAYSVAQTAEGALQESSQILLALRDMALRAANGGYQDEERAVMQHESRALLADFDRIARTTQFADQHLFNGSYGTKSFALGADGNAISLTLRSMKSSSEPMGGHWYRGDAQDDDWRVVSGSEQLIIDYQAPDGTEQSLAVELTLGDDLHQVATHVNARQGIVQASVSDEGELQFFSAAAIAPEGVELSGGLLDRIGVSQGQSLVLQDMSIGTQAQAQVAIAMLDGALKYVDAQRSEIGGFQNRVTGTLTNLQNTQQRLQHSHGQIHDVDLARESVRLVHSQVRHQATSALLAQANQSPNQAMRLLV